MTDRKQVLSLGAGVQSSVLLLMSCRGELPKLDMAIFADTQWEPKGVYEHLDWLRIEADRAGIPIVTLATSPLREDAIEFRRNFGKKKRRYASMPMFVRNPSDNSIGMIRRQCTSEYKIIPIETYLRREVLGLRYRQQAPQTPVIDQWRGITIDEPWRIKESRVKWYRVIYPFCGMPTDWGSTLSMDRHACHRWFAERYPGRILPRSACIGCPFHSDEEWRRLRDESPEEWADAVDFDRQMRIADADGQRAKGIIVGKPYLHPSCQPLDEAPVDASDSGPVLWGNECEGMCGL